MRAVSQIAAVAPQSLDEIVTDGSISLPNAPGTPRRVLALNQIKSIVPLSNTQPIFAVVKIPEKTFSKCLPAESGNRILICEDIQDPGNIGTLIRSAAAFGFSGVVMSDQCADPFAPKAVQSSAGSILSLWIRRSADYMAIVDELVADKWSLVATDLAGSPNTSWTCAEKLMIALGNEGIGISPELRRKARDLFRIPMHAENVESLNVAMSGAICMFLAARSASNP